MKKYGILIIGMAMKKILCVIASLVMLFTLAFGLSACGDGNDGVSVETSYIDSDGNLIIKLTDGREINCGRVESDESFYYTAVCEDGQTVSYTVRSIGSVSDAEIIIPAEYKGKPVTAIGENAFFNCKYITGVILPDSVESIGENAFNGCERLISVDLGEGVKTIGDGAFAYCHSLEAVEIPSSARTIGSDVFANCYSLSRAVINEGVERIGRSVFTGCNALEEVNFPDTIAGVGEDENGDFSMTATFMNCVSLKRVKLPARIEYIPQWFFAGCIQLETVEIGKSVKSVGYSAFFDNGAMQSIVLPASLVTCESYSFYKLYSLESVFFEGTAAQWAAIEIGRLDSGGTPLAARSTIGDMFGESVTVYFYSESRPTEEGSFWRYVNGKPVKW